MNIIEKIIEESKNSRDHYGPFNSTHEAYGVLMEEVEEFWHEVKTKDPDQKWKASRMISELIQVSSIAHRLAEELQKNEVKWV